MNTLPQTCPVTRNGKVFYRSPRSKTPVVDTDGKVHTARSPEDNGWIELLRAMFDYDPETGAVTRKLKYNKSSAAGEVLAHRNSNGYLYVSLFRKGYGVHRIAWAIYYGEWHQGELDHKNRDRADNRIGNLRAATRSENVCNANVRVSNTSGITGVFYNQQHDYWYGRVTKGGKHHHAGSFNNMDDCAEAVRVLRLALHGEFANA